MTAHISLLFSSNMRRSIIKIVSFNLVDNHVLLPYNTTDISQN